VTRLTAAGLILLWLGACAPRTAAAPPGENSAGTGTPSRPAITLERTACFGSCPVYTLSVSPSGEVTYEGKAHVRVLGAATAQIPKQGVDALLSELEKAGYFSFASRYASAEPTCGRYAVDLPTVITSATLDGRTKRIEHDYGCGAAPGALVVLERRIDEGLGSGRWTGR
jgi:hypothetical protein